MPDSFCQYKVSCHLTDDYRLFSPWASVLPGMADAGARCSTRHGPSTQGQTAERTQCHNVRNTRLTTFPLEGKSMCNWLSWPVKLTADEARQSVAVLVAASWLTPGVAAAPITVIERSDGRRREPAVEPPQTAGHNVTVADDTGWQTGRVRQSQESRQHVTVFEYNRADIWQTGTEHRWFGLWQHRATQSWLSPFTQA